MQAVGYLRIITSHTQSLHTAGIKTNPGAEMEQEEGEAWNNTSGNPSCLEQAEEAAQSKDLI